VGQVAGQAHRDMAIYRAWVDGARQVDLAEQYGVTHPAISQAVGRVMASMPAPEKETEVRRAVDLCDDLLAVFLPSARAGKASASREARGWLQLKAKWLGIDRREVHVSGTVEHDHYDRGPTLEQLIERWREQGKIGPAVQGEITRSDGGP
jgi:hypothetical protein